MAADVSTLFEKIEVASDLRPLAEKRTSVADCKTCLSAVSFGYFVQEAEEGITLN
jgi:hypothetical protein